MDIALFGAFVMVLIAWPLGRWRARVCLREHAATHLKNEPHPETNNALCDQ